MLGARPTPSVLRNRYRMEQHIDAALWEVTPEQFFLEFVRGVAAILRRSGAAKTMEEFAAPFAVTAADPSPEALRLYACERMRARVLGSSLGLLLRPCADPLTASECSGGHAGWEARLAALAAAPLAEGEEPTVFGCPRSRLEEMAAAEAPFKMRLGGLRQDWDALFRALVDCYGPGSEARCAPDLPDWRPVRDALDGDTGDVLWPWIDNAISLAGLIVMYLGGAPETDWPPERLLGRPRMEGGACVVRGILAGIAADGAFGAEHAVPAGAFPQTSIRPPAVSVVRPPDSDCPEGLEPEGTGPAGSAEQKT